MAVFSLKQVHKYLRVMEYFLYKAKKCLLDNVSIAVDCENKWVSKSTYTYNFLKITRYQEVSAEREFLEIYVKLYDLLSSATQQTQQPQPPLPPLNVKNINFKIKINSENICDEIYKKIELLKECLNSFSFHNLVDATTIRTTSELTEKIEKVLEIFNDICSLRYFYRKQQKFIQQRKRQSHRQKRSNSNVFCPQ